MSESYIRAYWNDIQSGAAIVGYYVRRQMEMLIDDLKSPDLRIDLDESEKRIRFIERECRHSEAPFAGKTFILLPFQKAILEAVFAIKTYNDELGRYVRKYQEVLLVMGRKNGKTPFASALSLSEWVCGEMGTKILYGSNDYDQADLLYTATDAMREASPKLARCTRRNQKGIFFGGKRQRNHVGKFTGVSFSIVALSLTIRRTRRIRKAKTGQARGQKLSYFSCLVPCKQSGQPKGDQKQQAGGERKWQSRKRTRPRSWS